MKDSNSVRETAAELPTTSSRNATNHFEAQYDSDSRELNCQIVVEGRTYRGVFAVSQDYFNLDLLGATIEGSELSQVEHCLISGQARDVTRKALKSILLPSGIEVR